MSAKGVVGGLIGAVGGFICGGPAGAVIGFAIGMGVGMAMDVTTADAPDTPGMGQIHAMDITTAELGDPLPDFIGTGKIAGNIIHSWGHHVVEITEQQSTPGGKAGGGGETAQTVVTGYKNYLSFLLALSYGPDPVNTVHTILFDDRVVYYGELTDDDDDGEETISLGDPSGEALGSATVYFGSSNQVANSKVGAALDDSTLNTAYKGLFYIFFDDIMIGNYGRAPSIKVIASKFPAIADIGSEQLAIVNDLNYNPAFAIWYLAVTHAGVPTTLMNAASFTTAASYFQNTDYIGISMFINRQVAADSYIEGIMSHAGASLVEKEGELYLEVLRDDVDEGDMESITDDLVIAIPTLTIGSWEDTYNDLKIVYSKINHTPSLVSGIFTIEIDSYTWKNEAIVYYSNVKKITSSGLIYAIASSGASHHIKTLQINNDGTIVKSIIDSYTGPTLAIQSTGFLEVAPNLFVHGNNLSSSAYTFYTINISNAGVIGSQLDLEDLGTFISLTESQQAWVEVSPGYFAFTYAQWSFGGYVSPRILLYAIDGLGIATPIDNLAFELPNYPRMRSMRLIQLGYASAIFVLTYETGTLLRIRTFDISTTTITKLSSYDIPITVCHQGHATANCVLGGFNGIVICWGNDTANTTMLETYAIDGVGNITSKDSVTLASSMTLFYGADIIRVGGNKYIVGHTVGGFGKMQSFSIDSNGTITLIDSLVLSASIYAPFITQLSTGKFVVSYSAGTIGKMITFGMN